MLVPLLEPHLVRQDLDLAEHLAHPGLELGGLVGRPHHQRAARPQDGAGRGERGRLVQRGVARVHQVAGAVVDVEQDQVVRRRAGLRQRDRDVGHHDVDPLVGEQRGTVGTVPSRIQSTSACSISTTEQSSTRESASTSCIVNPRPSPPTTTARGSSTRASASRASARSVLTSTLSMTNTPLTRSSRERGPSSGRRSREHELAPLGLGAGDLDVLHVRPAQSNSSLSQLSRFFLL